MTGLLINLFHSGVHSFEDEFGDLGSTYGDLISIATGQMQPIKKAPAVASIITQEVIEKSSAETLNDLLATIPGLHVSRRARRYIPIYSIRGIYSEFNPQILFLVDGQPVKSAFRGDRGENWSDMSIKNISHVEILRGPGSALYGADAFSGVINVITKKHDTAEPNVGFSVGSFNSRRLWLQAKGELAGWKSYFNLETYQTDGDDSVIDEDLQTLFDGIFGSSASLAPGEINREEKHLDVNLSFMKEDMEVNLAWMKRDDLGLGVGAAPALDPNGQNDGYYFLINAEKKNYQIGSQLTGTTRVEILNSEGSGDYVLFPPGATISFGTVNNFPNGVIGRPSVGESVYSLKQLVQYETEGHHMTFGAGYSYTSIQDITEEKNFSAIGEPLDAVVDVTGNDDLVFVLEQDRSLVYALFQDEIHLAPDWDLTIGARYDDYSDFGSTVNPRLALVWMADYDLTVKYLYG